MSNTKRTQSTQNRLPRRLQHGEVVTTLRSVRQDKPPPTRVRIASIQPVVQKNRARTHKHLKKRRTVQISGWGSSELRAEMKRIAESEGISLSQTVVAGCEELVRVRLERRREILQEPILEAMIDRKINRLINYLSQYLGRIAYETGQTRLLLINSMLREVIHPGKKLSKDEFYELLDKSSKDTLKNIHRFIPPISDVIEGIKQWLKEGQKGEEEIK